MLHIHCFSLMYIQAFLSLGNKDREMPTFWIFPYFFESRILEFFPSFSMMDYQVWPSPLILLNFGCVQCEQEYESKWIWWQYLSVGGPSCISHCLGGTANNVMLMWWSHAFDNIITHSCTSLYTFKSSITSPLCHFLCKVFRVIDFALI